jgi:hypothetical protein
VQSARNKEFVPMNKSFLWIVLSLGLAIGSGCASAESGKTTYVLFNGKDFSGWRQPLRKWFVAKSVSLNKENPHLLAAEPGEGLMVNGPEGKESNIMTEQEFGDIQAHIEFLVSSNSNSGIYFMGRYEVQIFDSWGKKEPGEHDCGAIYQRWKGNKGFEGHPPAVNACKRPGEWQTYDITFRAPRFDAAGKKIENARFIKVVQNGKTLHENVDLTGPTRSPAFDNEKPTGPLMIQGNHGPVALRNLRIQPISLP